MKKLFRSNGGLVLLIALLLAAITLVVSLIVSGADPLANIVGAVTTPFRQAGAAFSAWSERTFDERYRTEYLEEEVERLRQELSDMEAKARAGEDAIEENHNLRELLKLQQKRSDLTLENATVTTRTLSNWESSITISKGSNYGIEKDQCVIDAYGNLVGVVSEVGLNWATVLTVVDTGIDMGGMVSRTNDAAVLEGDFSLMTQGRLKLSYLPEDVLLVAGDEVLTSGRGGVYPAGLVVGSVESVHADPSGMTRYAVVEPKADLAHIKQVFVITSFDTVE